MPRVRPAAVRSPACSSGHAPDRSRPGPCSSTAWRPITTTRSLFEAREGSLPRIYALARSMPLGVEVPQLDPDLVFGLSGTGTFVTNGSIVEPRPLAANEGPGSAIADGTPRPLTPGAVLVVPS